MSNIKSLLFVEGINDKGFISGYLKVILPQVLDTIKVIDIGGIGGFQEALKSNETDIRNKPISKVGIILDIDNKKATDIINFVNDAFKKVGIYIEVQIDETLESSFMLGSRAINIYLFLMGDSTGKGELIDLLKEIKQIPDTIAECVTNCFRQKNDYSEKEIGDDWLHFYLKWDSCTITERGNNKNFNLRKAETIDGLARCFDFHSPKLDPLKGFLKKFS